MATTTNMGLILPDVSVTIGPTYATQNNTAFTSVDAHDHTSGSGVQVPTAGMNINATLEFNDNAATELLKAAFTSQASSVTGTNHLEVVSNELYFIDGAGNTVQITDGGALDITSSGGIGGDYTSAGAAVTYTDATNNYVFKNGSAVESELSFTDMINSGKHEWMTHNPAGDYVVTDTDARMIILADTSAARAITLPDPTLGRRVVVIKDDTGTAGTNNITITRNGAENIDGAAADKVVSVDNGCWALISDLTDWWTIFSHEPLETSEVNVAGGNGFGSTNTKIRRFSTININTGGAITYADSAADGASFTINQNGKYGIVVSDLASSGNDFFGFSLNGSQLTTDFGSTSYATGRRALASMDTTSGQSTWTGTLTAGDVVRHHSEGSGPNGNGVTYFIIIKLANG